MSGGERLEKLFERIRFLRDNKQRFYEGLGLAVIGLYGVAIGVRDLMGFFTAALGVLLAFLASLGCIAIEKELRALWDEVMKRDPRAYWLSIPVIALIGGIALLVVSILQLLGFIP